jgi:hypothetical protein
MSHLFITPILLRPVNTGIFSFLHNFSFSRMSYSWNHSIYLFFDWLQSLDNTHLSFFHISWLDSSFVLAQNSISLSGCITPLLSIYLLKDILVFTKFWQLQIKVLYNSYPGWLVVNTCNHSNLRGWVHEYHGLRPIWAKSFWDHHVNK